MLQELDPRLAGIESELDQALNGLNDTNADINSSLDEFKTKHKTKLRIAFTLGVVCLFIFPTISFLIFGGYAFFRYAVMPFANKVIEKAYLVTPIAQALNLDYTLKGNTLICEEARAAGIIPKGYRMRAEDAFTGHVSGVPYYFTELVVESGPNSAQGSLFKGAIIKLSLPKANMSEVLVLQDAGLWNKLKNAFQVYQGMEQVSLESVEFENQYQVYAKDQIDARKLLTPEYMERLTQVKAFYTFNKPVIKMAQPKIKIQMYAHGNELIIALDYAEDYFNPIKMHKSFDHAWAKDIAQQFILIESLAKSLIKQW